MRICIQFSVSIFCVFEVCFFSAYSFHLDFIFVFAPVPATALVILCSVHSDFLISYYSVSFHTIALFFFERHFFSINSCLVLCVVLWLAG